MTTKFRLLFHGAMMSGKRATLCLRRWGNWGSRRLLLLAWWLLFDLSGIRLIYEKIRPPLAGNSMRRPAASLGLWVLGLYFAAFGIASQRYENAVSRIEARANGIYAQVGTGRYLQAIERIPDAQHMTCPRKPVLGSPLSIYRSLCGAPAPDQEISDRLKDLVVCFKDELSGADLRRVDLSQAKLASANLFEADLSGAKLVKTDLREAKLVKVNLGRPFNIVADYSRPSLTPSSTAKGEFQTPGSNEKRIHSFCELQGETIKGIAIPTHYPAADLTEADLSWGILTGANLAEGNLRRSKLKFADLRWADLRGADLGSADLSGADLSGANLLGAANLTQRQIDSASADPDNLPVLDKGFYPPFPRDAEARAEARLLRALLVSETKKDNEGIANAHYRLGAFYADHGDRIKAENHALRALTAYESLGNTKAVGQANVLLGWICQALGRREEAENRYLLGIQLLQKHEHWEWCANIYATLVTLICDCPANPLKAEHYLDLLTTLKGQHMKQLSRACNNLAWLYATSPDASIRNGNRALELAQKAVAEMGDDADFRACCLSMLAAAYARAGDFRKAVDIQQRALAELRDESLRKTFKQELTSYMSGVTWEQPADENQPQQEDPPDGQ